MDTRPGYLVILSWSLGYRGGVKEIARDLARDVQVMRRFMRIVRMMSGSVRGPTGGEYCNLRAIRWHIPDVVVERYG